MPFNTKALKTDMNGKPVPQIFGVTDDDFLSLTGVDLGNGRAGQDALQWGMTSGGVYVPIQVDAKGVVQTNGKQTPYDSSGVEKFTGSNPGSVQLTGSNASDNQTQNAVVVSGPGSNTSAWIDTKGFNEISITMMAEASDSFDVELNWSHDGINKHSHETLIPAGTIQYGAANTKIKARYVQVILVNNSSTSHTLSGWAYLMQ